MPLFVHPMPAGNWMQSEKAFLRFIDARNVEDYEKPSKSALLLDPDTGIHAKKSRKHTTVAEIVKLMGQHTIVFVFDQSFSYGPKSHEPLLAKLRLLRDSGAHGFYYDSHARFLFCSLSQRKLNQLRKAIVDSGLPAHRLVSLTPSS